ncbi:CHRD domain-containing protein [Rhodococcus marinonascens]|uniref:CHRD domain-containing protein n=1 Tax=Rhodococcus marinonascens TaxID=38311 RepID=UPI0009348328|nr:CHRD domain-containing protein [Rhodococcus marinonascens]
MLRSVGVCFAAASVLVLSACSSSSTSDDSAASSATSASAAEQVLPTITLEDMPTGTASLSWDPDTMLVTAAIDMHGFTPSSSHAMHIHPGTCADQTQPPSVPFPDVVADASGAVEQTVVSAAVPEGIPTESYLNIHLAPMAELGAPTDVSFTPIACGDIPADTAAAGPAELEMQTPPLEGQTPQGTATLTYDSDQQTLGVEVRASGLQPDSAHAVHVHSGSCAAQGPVVYPVPDLQADGSGEATTTITIDNVDAPPPATGWYVNVHMGSMNEIADDSGPTLLFAPIICGDVTE